VAPTPVEGLVFGVFRQAAGRRTRQDPSGRVAEPAQRVPEADHVDAVAEQGIAELFALGAPEVQQRV